jgi:hypothetical protein
VESAETGIIRSSSTSVELINSVTCDDGN